MKKVLKKSISDNLSKYILNKCTDSDIIEIIEWDNCEGIDIKILYKDSVTDYSMSYDILNAIVHISNEFKYSNDKDFILPEL